MRVQAGAEAGAGAEAKPPPLRCGGSAVMGTWCLTPSRGDRSRTFPFKRSRLKLGVRGCSHVEVACQIIGKSRHYRGSRADKTPRTWILFIQTNRYCKETLGFTVFCIADATSMCKQQLVDAQGRDWPPKYRFKLQYFPAH